MSELIGQAVDRFLRWKLPEDFAPDGGISFDPHRLGSPRLSPTGTNLLNAIQAEAMLEHVAAPLLARIAELEEILLHAVIVDEAETDSDKVSIGCRVIVTNLENGKQLPAYKIVGSQEADVMNHAISEDSPFGKALMGKRAGEEISVEAPRGMMRYRVDQIER